MVCIAVLNHLLACGWFGMSKISEEGWTLRHGFDEQPFHFQYLTSLHWSFSNFQGNMEIFPNNYVERFYAVIVLYLGLIIVSYFISSLTHFMSQIQLIHSN